MTLEPTPPAEQVTELPVAQIVANPLQPRRRFVQAHIQALAESIRHQGIIQPVVVRPQPGGGTGWELVAGERRLRAVQWLGRVTIPAVVRHIPDRDLLETALVENLQREQLTPVEEAQAYRDLLDLHGYTQDTLAQRVGRDRSTIANLVRLLALPQALQDDLEEGHLTIGHARALLPLEDVPRQLELGQRIVQEGLSVREVERLVKRLLAQQPPTPEPPAPPLDPAYTAVQHLLERRLGTRVAIHQQNHQGRIEIEFYSLEDFNRVYEMLSGKK